MSRQGVVTKLSGLASCGVSSEPGISYLKLSDHLLVRNSKLEVNKNKVKLASHQTVRTICCLHHYLCYLQ